MKDILIKNIDYLKNKDIYVRTSYNLELEKLVETKNIVILEWQRRVWKSSIIISYLKWKNIDLEKVFYINKELDLLDEISWVKELDLLFTEYKGNYWEPEYIIIDEVQDIEWWEKFIRACFTYKKYKIIITWSNSKLLSWELATFLTWRYLTLEVYSFSYKEYIEFKKIELNEESFKKYLEIWWMPELLFIEDEETRKNYLKNVLNSIILKDIVSRFNIRDIRLIEKILWFLANNTWSLVSITNITAYLKNQFKKEYSTKTIANYLKYLEYPFIVNEVQRYDLKWKKILEYVWKYYFSDIWIRNTFWFIYAQDIWKILENLVYLKLKQDWYTVYIWDNYWTEIDFVALKWWEKLYIQVCYMFSSGEVIDREFWNLLKIKDNYRKIVLSMDKSFWNSYSWVESINIIDWLNY